MCVQFQIVFVGLSEVSASRGSSQTDCIMTSQLLKLLMLTLTLLSLQVRCLPVEEEYQYDDPTEEVSILFCLYLGGDHYYILWPNYFLPTPLTVVMQTYFRYF